ncbi:MAG: glycoside hydrolase family 30 beta sandwich domain-containing protein [Mobilitalea sp.]
MQFKVWKTNWNKSCFWKEEEVVPNELDCMKQLNIHPDLTCQRIDGFGGAFTEASAYTYSLLTEKAKQEFLDSYFGEEGLKYNMGRTHMNSCDFSLGNYACLEDPEDTAMESFSIERDKKYIIPLISQAQKKLNQPIQLLISPWSPPAFMKTTGEMNFGGKLKAEYGNLWAKYFARFIKAYQEAGLNPTMITVQNEPDSVQTWDSCTYTGEEEREFVKKYLGPVLKEEGLEDIKVFIWDHNKESIYTRAKTILRDEIAAQYVDGVAFHWYTGDHFEEVALVRDAYPDKLLYFTEGCVEYSRFAETDEIRKAEMYAHDMMGNFNAGMQAFIDWNLLLDEMGGPNHVGNYCAAPIMSNESKNEIIKNLSYYYIGHFSRFVKPGAKRIASSRYTDKIEAAGFLNPDQQRVVVILNKTEQDIPVSIFEYGKGQTVLVEARSIITVTYYE